MSNTDLSELNRVNATGYGDQDRKTKDGGNDTRGVFDQMRPTGIVARGDKKKSRKIGVGTRGM